MFEIRAATKRDIAAVDVLLARAYPRLLRADYPASVLVTALPRISRAQPGLVTCGTYYLVEEAGVLRGAGGWTAQPPGSGKVTPKDGHIRHVVTDDRAVRRGVGRALMGHILREARAAGLERMNCLSTRTAVPFYGAMGFVRQRDVDVPLDAGITFPAVQMARAI